LGEVTGIDFMGIEVRGQAELGIGVGADASDGASVGGGTDQGLVAQASVQRLKTGREDWSTDTNTDEEETKQGVAGTEFGLQLADDGDALLGGEVRGADDEGVAGGGVALTTTQAGPGGVEVATFEGAHDVGETGVAPPNFEAAQEARVMRNEAEVAGLHGEGHDGASYSQGSSRKRAGKEKRSEAREKGKRSV
jgi:hypothetical protein